MFLVYTGIPAGAKFSAPVQAGPGAHPSSCTMGTGSFPGVKRPGRGVDHPSPSSAEVEGRVELYIWLPLWAFLACSMVKLLYLLLQDVSGGICHTSGKRFSG